MATLSKPKAARAGRGERVAGYIQPGRIGKKPLVGYFSKEAHKAVKQLALDLDLKVEDLLGEALHDLLVKRGKLREAELFKD